MNHLFKHTLPIGFRTYSVKSGQIYRHYKGNLYKVYAVAKHTETEQDLVIYKSIMNTDQFWARPLDMFQSNVKIDGTNVKRFALMCKNV